MSPRRRDRRAPRPEANLLARRPSAPSAGFRRTLLAAVSGLLAVLAFPPADIGWLVLPAATGLLLSVRGATWRQGMAVGIAFAVPFFGLLIFWISLFGYLAWVALVAAQAGYFAVFGVAGTWVSRLGWAGRIAGVPLVFTGIELVRARWPLGGFGWGVLGYAQHDPGAPLLPLARVGGVELVTLAILVVAALLAEAIVAERHRPRAALAAAALIALFAPAALPVGLAGPPAGEPLEIAVVQGNVPRGSFQGFRSTGRRGPEDVTIVRNHVRLSKELADDPPDLVVWPENAVDRDPFRTPAVMSLIQEAIAAVGRPFLVGVIRDVPPDGFRNSNILFAADGSVVEIYDKNHLVPFGEYVPWPVLRRYIPALEQIASDGIPGSTPVVFEVAGAKVGSVICFESTFPGLVADHVRAGAEIIVVSTNNASFGTSPAARQHLAMSQMRAVEQGRAVVHAAISGISALIGPDGRIAERSELFEPLLLRAYIPRASDLTPFGRHGTAVHVVLAIGAAITALGGAAAAGRPRQAEGDDPMATTTREDLRQAATPAAFAPVRRPAGAPATAPHAPASPATRLHTLVVLPTYNEAGTIREVVNRALLSTPDVDVLVVDDNSPDGTGRIADEIAAVNPRVRVLHRPAKMGLGPAYIAGFREALALGFDAVIEMDSDLSHDPSDLPRLIAAASQADIVVGSRYVDGGRTENWSPRRERLSRGGNAYARLMLGLPVADATSGFRLYRRRVLEVLSLGKIRSEGYAFQVEMLWRAWQTGFVIGEVPIAFTERREGSSKMSRRIVAEAVRSVLRWSFELKGAPPVPHPFSIASPYYQPA